MLFSSKVLYIFSALENQCQKNERFWNLCSGTLLEMLVLPLQCTKTGQSFRQKNLSLDYEYLQQIFTLMLLVLHSQHQDYVLRRDKSVFVDSWKNKAEKSVTKAFLNFGFSLDFLYSQTDNSVDLNSSEVDNASKSLFFAPGCISFKGYKFYSKAGVYPQEGKRNKPSIYIMNRCIRKLSKRN